MSQNKTAYVYNKGGSRYVSANGQRVRKGEEIELTDAQLIDLTHQGFIFSPADKRRKMPTIPDESEKEEVVIEE